MSAADQRGHDWFLRWVELGGEIKPDATGSLVLAWSLSEAAIEQEREMAGMADSIRCQPLLAHAVGRALLNFYRWDDAQAANR